MRPLAVLVAAAAVACASTGAGTASGTQRGSSNLITADEITASQQTNAYDAVSKLRPNFLTTRGRSSMSTSASSYAAVFLDGAPYGDLSTLRSITAAQIREIRYIAGTDAVTKYGMQYGAGVIDVRTR